MTNLYNPSDQASNSTKAALQGSKQSKAAEQGSKRCVLLIIATKSFRHFPIDFVLLTYSWGLKVYKIITLVTLQYNTTVKL